MEAPKQYLNVEAEASNQLEGFITCPGRPVRRRWALTCVVTALVLMAVAFGSFGGAAALKASVNKASTAVGKAFVGGHAFNFPATRPVTGHRPGNGLRHGTGGGTRRHWSVQAEAQQRNDRPPTRPMSTLASREANEAHGGSTRNEDPRATRLKLEAVDTYINNTRAAVGTLTRDIPQTLRLESDPQRMAPTNWNVFTDDLVTEVKAEDPMSLRILDVLVPSWREGVKGLTTNQRSLEELRMLFKFIRLSKLVEGEEITVKVRHYVDPSTREEVIETRWTTKLPFMRLQPPKWLPLPPFVRAPPREPDKRIVIIQAVDNYHLNAEGKIYRQSIDELSLLEDGKPLGSEALGKLLDVIAFGYKFLDGRGR